VSEEKDGFFGGWCHLTLGRGWWLKGGRLENRNAGRGGALRPPGGVLQRLI